MFSLIENCFHITIEQMAIMEPAIAEVVSYFAGYIIKEAF